MGQTLSTPTVLLALQAFGVLSALVIGYYGKATLFRSSKLRSLKGPRNGNFWVGHMLEETIYEPSMLGMRWVKEHGPVLRVIGSLNSPTLFTTDMRALNHVIHHSDIYQKPAKIRNFLARLLGWGVLVTEGDQHRLQRKVLNPAFGPGQVRDLTGIFIDKANELRSQWTSLLTTQANADGSCRVESLRWYSRATLDIIGLAGFGYAFNALSALPGTRNELDTAFRHLLGGLEDSVFQQLCVIFPVLRMLPLEANTQTKWALSVVNRIGGELLEERKSSAALEAAQGEKIENSQARDLLSLLVRANVTANAKERLSDAEVLAQIPTFLIAGHETTSTLLSWITFRLSSMPDVQTRLREECRSHPLPTSSCNNDPLTPQELTALDKLPLLDAVVRETLRLHAPVAETYRVATRDDVIPTSRPYVDAEGVEHHEIPMAKGDVVAIPCLLMHRLEELWGPDADAWRPDRWLEEDGISTAVKSVPGVYSNLLAFLGGAHACIGWKFSLYETKIILHSVVSSFEMQLAVDPKDIGAKSGVVTRPYVRSQAQAGTQMPLVIRRVAESS